MGDSLAKELEQLVGKRMQATPRPLSSQPSDFSMKPLRRTHADWQTNTWSYTLQIHLTIYGEHTLQVLAQAHPYSWHMHSLGMEEQKINNPKITTRKKLALTSKVGVNTACGQTNAPMQAH